MKKHTRSSQTRRVNILKKVIVQGKVGPLSRCSRAER